MTPPLPAFTGALADMVSGAYPLGNGYRWYLPALMRFNASDSASPFGAGGANPYAYCGGDPINRSDPTGHALEQDIQAVEQQAASGAAAQAASDASIAATEAQKAAEAEESGPSTSGAAGAGSPARNTRKRRASPETEDIGELGDRPSELILEPFTKKSRLLPEEVATHMTRYRAEMRALDREVRSLPASLREEATTSYARVAEAVLPEPVVELRARAINLHRDIERLITSLEISGPGFHGEVAEARQISDRALGIGLYRRRGPYPERARFQEN